MAQQKHDVQAQIKENAVKAKERTAERQAQIKQTEKIMEEAKAAE